ncbi:putative 2-aminoethylphosphonate ABC transporter permease subunit [Paenibacillus chitinolyticus]|uniref:putative 2-aminoethylphosphonate ABC transporter permease subunit n=1 Tax=Paenibacillus chitinolyticus TaxID=79263 RepID=UPI0036DAA2C4
MMIVRRVQGAARDLRSSLTGTGGRIRRRHGKEERMQQALIALMIAVLAVTVLLPLIGLFSKAFYDKTGQFAGLENFVVYFTTPALLRSLLHTLNVSLLTTVISVGLAFLYAYALTRTDIKGRTLFRYIALLPLFAPTMMHGIGLIYLFGNQGLVTTGLFGLLPAGLDIGLYGPVGIVLAEVAYTFPQAMMIMLVSLAVTDNRLYEAAETLGAGKWRTFLSVTLPSVKYGVISALFVCFTMSFTDFGAPKIVGGNYNVLATDIYKQVIGQQNMTMGAAVGILLTLPAILAFAVDRFVERRQKTLVSSKSVPYRIQKGSWRNAVFYVICSLIGGAILLLLGAVVFASVIKVWPYELSFTWNHFDFTSVAGEGLAPFWNSMQAALYTALIGTAVTFVFAYLIEKVRHWHALRQFAYFLSILPLALPGMVIGLAFIFFFNRPDNPLSGIYGTIWIVVLANIVHFYAVPFITATAALKKLDKEFETVSESMRVPFYRTFARVTVPMSLPAVLEMFVYYFVNSMVTVSAVVFLYSADFKLASVAIVNMDDAGDTAPAAAMSVLILLTNIVVRIGYEQLTKVMRNRASAWQRK